MSNEQLLKPARRFHWWWIPVLLLPIAAGALIHWLRKPLPPPVVSLSLVGFKVYPTNTYAVMSLSNLGPTRIYFDGQSWEAELETSDGVQTNKGRHFTVTALGTRQHSNDTFWFNVPSNTLSWRVTALYTYYHRRNARLELAEWFFHSGFNRAFEFCLPVIRRIPMPNDESGEITTSWQTNLPPSAAVSLE